MGRRTAFRAQEGVRRDRSVVADANGRIWLSLARGLAMAAPPTSASYMSPVRVRVESISIGGTQTNPEDSPRLPSGTRSIMLNYADTNLAMPQRIRYRYRLDGSDHGWSDTVSLRQVVYTNLGPGPYQFRIMAFERRGTVEWARNRCKFEIAPAFWQTSWFRIACAAIVLLMILAIYRLRMAQLTEQLNVRFNERMAERVRIAQDLHDTLLQGVLSASLQLDLAEEKIPAESPAKPLLKRVLQLMQQVTEEGRKALQGLRTPGGEGSDLEVALSRLGDEFSLEDATAYRVVAHGIPQTLHRQFAMRSIALAARLSSMHSCTLTQKTLRWK